MYDTGSGGEQVTGPSAVERGLDDDGRHQPQRLQLFPHFGLVRAAVVHAVD